MQSPILTALDYANRPTQLETIKVSFDGGRTTLNFAEAALLIQGSAAVYSRKVEFLYSLIYQTLDLLHVQNRRHKVGTGRGRPSLPPLPILHHLAQRLQNDEVAGAAEDLEAAQDEAEE